MDAGDGTQESMTGMEHYREAERLIRYANHVGHEDPQRGDGIIAAAQVHAILALAAATAGPMNFHLSTDWGGERRASAAGQADDVPDGILRDRHLGSEFARWARAQGYPQDTGDRPEYAIGDMAEAFAAGFTSAEETVTDLGESAS